MTRIDDRLRTALRDEVETPASDGDWEEFESRLARRATRHRVATWRTPLIAAAAVAIIAVVTSAIVTRGFGLAEKDRAASSPAEDTACADALATADPITTPITNAAEGDAAVALAMYFTGGRPPDARLCAAPAVAGAKPATTGSVSDRTPLGYLTLTPAPSSGDGAVLWGAVGPAVDMVAVTAIPERATSQPDADDSAPGTTGRHDWMFASSADPGWRISDDPAIVWTPLGAGWHGFAVQLPLGTGTVLALATNSVKGAVQSRSFDAVTGAFINGEDPQMTAASGYPASDAARPHGAPIVATYPDSPGEGGMRAQLTGRVTVTGGCITVIDGDGATVTPVFPTSQVGAADPPALFTFRGNRYGEGSVLSVAGGYVGSAKAGAPAGCPDQAFVINTAT